MLWKYPRVRRWAEWCRRDLHWLLVAAVLMGVALKVLIATNPLLGRLNSDQAVLYLSARHVRDGVLPAWFWGQEYGGATFQIVLGGLFLVTGPHLWLFPVLLGAVSTAVPLLTWRVGVALGYQRQASVAGALVALGPPTWLYLGVDSEAFYTVGMALSLGALLVAIGATTRVRVFSVGWLVGLAIWTSPFSVLTALPALVMVLPHLRRAPRRAALLVLGGVVGGMPVLTTALRRGSLYPATRPTGDSVSRRIEEAVTGTWSELFTRFHPRQVPDWLIDHVAVAGLLLAVVYGVARILTARRDLASAALLLPVVLWIPFHVRGQLPYDAPASRYAVPLLPFVSLVVVRWLVPRRRAVGAAVALGAFSAVGLWQATSGLSFPGHVLHDRGYQALAAELQREGRHAVWADYWISYRLAAVTDERIVAEPPIQPRQPAYGRAAAAAPQTTFVVFAGQPNDTAFTQRFAGDSRVRRVTVAQFVVFLADTHIDAPGFQSTEDVP